MMALTKGRSVMKEMGNQAGSEQFIGRIMQLLV
jgi:hypothetical protein